MFGAVCKGMFKLTVQHEQMHLYCQLPTYGYLYRLSDHDDGSWQRVLTVQYVMTLIVSTDSTVCDDIYCTVDTNNTVCGDTHTHTHTPQHHQLSETPRIAAGCNTPIIYENRGNIWALKIKKIVRRLRNLVAFKVASGIVRSVSELNQCQERGSTLVAFGVLVPVQ